MMLPYACVIDVRQILCCEHFTGCNWCKLFEIVWLQGIISLCAASCWLWDGRIACECYITYVIVGVTQRRYRDWIGAGGISIKNPMIRRWVRYRRANWWASYIKLVIHFILNNRDETATKIILRLIISYKKLESILWLFNTQVIPNYWSNRVQWLQ